MIARSAWVRSRSVASLSILLLATGSAGAPGAAKSAPAVSRRGMVSSAHPLATRAGVEILRMGGNAFDAAVAVAAALNVVEPMMSGIGGYGTILVFDAKDRRVRFLNASGRIPAGLNPDVFREPYPNALANRNGAAAVSTPGNLHAWEALSRERGRLSWEKLLEPAIRLAEAGFAIDERTARAIERSFESFAPSIRSFYGRDGRPLSAGERLVQGDLGRTLRRIAKDGPSAFYQGPIAESVVKTLGEHGGFLSMEDLRGDRSEWFEPIRVSYRGNEIYTASPPSTAFPSLIRLGMMSRFDVAGLGHNTPEFLHRFIETTKHAFWCRLAYAGDPEVSPPPLGRLLSEPYWREQAARIDMTRARPFVYPGKGGPPDQHTTHFVVADADGHIVSATQTLGNLFGSRIMPEGTGVWLNDSLAYCTFEPKGNPMDAHPGRRKLSGDCPTIIARDGRPWAALGTPGGHTIGQTVPQIVMNLVDFGMDVQRAIDAPRISFIEPDEIAVEEAISAATLSRLEALGHKLYLVRKPGGLGNAHGLTIEYGRDGRPSAFAGGADSRGSGLAEGR